MTTEITRVGTDRYSAVVTPPPGLWRSVDPLDAHRLVNKLRDLECHTTDISDAFYAADPLWLNRIADREAQGPVEP